MGDPSMIPLPAMPGVIDYAHSPLRCDWMDVFLCARVRFMLGSASGMCVLASTFGVPCAVANQSLPTVALPYGTADLFIPKLLRSVPSGSLNSPNVPRSSGLQPGGATRKFPADVPVVRQPGAANTSVHMSSIGRR